MSDNGMQFHPFANLVPAMSDSQFVGLMDDIDKHGQTEPIDVLDGKILDGRNRYRACIILSKKPRTRQFKGNDPIGYVWSQNGARRHMTVSQLACFAADIAVELQKTEGAAAKKKAGAKGGKIGGRGRSIGKASKDAKPNGQSKKAGQKSTEKAATITGASAKTTETALAIKRKDPKLFEQVKAGKKTVGAAAKEIKKRHPDNQTAKERYPLSTGYMKTLNHILAALNHVRDEHGTMPKMFKDPRWEPDMRDQAKQLLIAIQSELNKMVKEVR